VKIYICSDIHNQFHKFPAVTDVNLVLCAGDITNVGVKNRWGKDYKESRLWLDDIGNQGKTTTLFVPGNHDIGWHRQQQSEFSHNILGKRYRLSCGLDVCGASMSTAYDMPSLATRWDNMTCNPEVEAAYYESIEPCDILLSHSPPSGSLGFCTVNQKDFGSKELRKWIIKNQPKLVVCGHIHDPHLEQEWIGSTRVINTATKWSVIDF
jgi:uncharacterized protein